MNLMKRLHGTRMLKTESGKTDIRMPLRHEKR